MKRGLVSVILAIAILVAWGNLSVAKAQGNEQLATELGLVNGAGQIVNQSGAVYFDPRGKTFSVTVPEGCTALWIIGYDTDKYGDDRSQGWRVNWDGGSLVLHSKNNEWVGTSVNIMGPNEILFDSGGDSHGANVSLNCSPQDPSNPTPQPTPTDEPEEPIVPSEPEVELPVNTMFCRMPNTFGLELGKYSMFNRPIVEVKAEGVEVTIVTNQSWETGPYRIYGENGLVAEFTMEVGRDATGSITGISCEPASKPEATVFPSTSCSEGCPPAMDERPNEYGRYWHFDGLEYIESFKEFAVVTVDGYYVRAEKRETPFGPVWYVGSLKPGFMVQGMRLSDLAHYPGPCSVSVELTQVAVYGDQWMIEVLPGQWPSVWTEFGRRVGFTEELSLLMLPQMARQGSMIAFYPESFKN